MTQSFCCIRLPFCTVAEECQKNVDCLYASYALYVALLIFTAAFGAQGSNFATICEMTDIFEGSIVRFMRRLDELMGQLIKAANVSSPKSSHKPSGIER